ncbi:MAG: AraC family transcriptional regulator [Candidatus Hydrogenedentes bacterium]|nr:AraC family transcriptional regulator [Candidatus Hydrogenedentota bacterium]
MTAAAFLRGAGAARVVERASRCGGIPVCIHVPQGPTWLKAAGAGSCSACSYLASTPGGKDACEQCRGAAASAAVRSAMGRPFICHAGFACYCAPATGGAVVTFGPYCPAEQPESLAADFMAGLAKLGEKTGNLPVSLADVRLVPSSAVPALAAWTVETLEALRARELAAESAQHDPAQEPRESVPRRRAAKRAQADPYGAGPIAAALAGGAHDKARALFRAALSEAPGAKKTAIGVKRARAVAAAAAVLESAARASLPVETCWEHFGGMIDEMRQARNELQLANTAMRVLGRIKRERRKSGAAPAKADRFAELGEIVAAHLESGITLKELARRLGQTPTAITHRLQRNFGMSYSDYVGRLRVDRAKELLRRTRLTVEAVGRRVGIEDPSNFRKLFRKFEPMSPQEYRERFGVKK